MPTPSVYREGCASAQLCAHHAPKVYTSLPILHTHWGCGSGSGGRPCRIVGRQEAVAFRSPPWTWRSPTPHAPTPAGLCTLHTILASYMELHVKCAPSWEARAGKWRISGSRRDQEEVLGGTPGLRKTLGHSSYKWKACLGDSGAKHTS